MSPEESESNSVRLYFNELNERIIAESGNPSDRNHFGKIILQALKDAPDFVLQIDGATGETETNESILQRSVRCATTFKKRGLKSGDIIVIMGPNHIDLCIPMYAALYLGIGVASVDMTLGVSELCGSFEISEPKLIFCQSNKATDVLKALDLSEIKSKIITFDESVEFECFSELLKVDEDDKTLIGNFKGEDINTDETTIWLIATSGTTGLPKAANVTHKNFVSGVPTFCCMFSNFPTPFESCIIYAPLQWMTVIAMYVLSAACRFTRIQTSKPSTEEHFLYLINKYKPAVSLSSPTFMATLLKSNYNQCNFSNFIAFIIGGSFVSDEILQNIKTVAKNAKVMAAYGMSEICGLAMVNFKQIPNSDGVLLSHLRAKLVDVKTEKEITEANFPGELWLTGPSVFKEYYKNSEVTKKSFSEDGWYKTGDLLYRDENLNFYFVDRLKLMLKYKNHQISPVEVEEAISKHPAVHLVAVTGIPDPVRGDLVTAFVVPHDRCTVTAQEIKTTVKDSLADSKQLRGGVIFVKQLPMTPSSKIDRAKLKEMATVMKRE